MKFRPCETCDRQDVQVTATLAAFVDLHRQMHDVGRMILAEFERLLRWLTRRADPA